MTGHRRARTCRLDMVPPPGEAGRVVVERERRVAGDVLLRKGHIERDCLRSVSIPAVGLDSCSNCSKCRQKYRNVFRGRKCGDRTDCQQNNRTRTCTESVSVTGSDRTSAYIMASGPIRVDRLPARISSSNLRISSEHPSRHHYFTSPTYLTLVQY